MSIFLALPLIEKALDRIFPDPAKAAEAKIKLAELHQAGELASLDADVKVIVGQLEINKVEAASTNWFVAGWRPAAGWACVGGLVYTFLLCPLLGWVSLIFGIAPPPVIETGILISMLSGLLGLGGIRSFEKYKDVARS